MNFYNPEVHNYVLYMSACITYIPNFELGNSGEKKFLQYTYWLFRICSTLI